MEWDTRFEMQILQAIEQHPGPRNFGHYDLSKIVEDDRYVEATLYVKRMYDDGLVTATDLPKLTLQSRSYGFILGGLTQQGRERLNKLMEMQDADL